MAVKKNELIKIECTKKNTRKTQPNIKYYGD